MKKLFSLFARVPKRGLVMAAAIVAIVTPALVMAYGPERRTFTMEQPAPYVTFNSITNNPNYGDEREFMTVKDLTTGGSLTAEAKMVPGHEYQFQMYVHNNASETLNASGQGVAKDVTVRAALPASVTGNETADGFVRASNANPLDVYDSAKLTSDGKVDLEFVNGSAKLSTHFQQTALPDSLITSGVKVGHKDLSGNWNGCLEFAGAVTFKVKAKTPVVPKYDFTKDVRKSGSTDKYAENVSVKPGEKVDFRLSFKNTGPVKLNNVVLKDTLPAGMTYVADSAKLYNSNYPNGFALGNTLFGGGANIGNYDTNINAFVVFTAQVAANDTLPKCGDNHLRNIAKVDTDYGNKEDDASVDVKKECQEKPAYKCTALNVETITRTQFKATAEKQVQNADFVKFIYVVRDADGKEVARNETGNFTVDKVGKYTVEAQLVVKVNGQEQAPVTSPECKKPFEVKEQPPKNEFACEALAKIQKSRDTFDFTVTPKAEGNVKVKEYNFNFGDGQSQIVGADQKTVTHIYKAAGDYTAQVSIAFEVDGKTVANVTSDKCKVALTVKPAECKPGIPVEDARCKEQPQTPKELPSTGPEAVVGGLFGSSALGLGVHSWLNSRRALKNVIKK